MDLIAEARALVESADPNAVTRHARASTLALISIAEDLNSILRYGIEQAI